jgi:hypothetical protein
VWGKLPWQKIAPIMWIEEALYLLEENHPFYKEKGLANCFIVRIKLTFERKTAYHSEFSNVRDISFV